jgi:hypothetical protein
MCKTIRIRDVLRTSKRPLNRMIPKNCSILSQTSPLLISFKASKMPSTRPRLYFLPKAMFSKLRLAEITIAYGTRTTAQRDGGSRTPSSSPTSCSCLHSLTEQCSQPVSQFQCQPETSAKTVAFRLSTLMKTLQNWSQSRRSIV